MKVNSQIILVVFGPLSHKGQSGLALFNYKLAKYLYDRGSLAKVYCLGYDNGLDIPKNKIAGLRDFLFFRLLFRLIKTIGRFTSIRADRLMIEWVFDFYYGHTIKFKEADILLNLKPANPFVNKKAKQNGLFIATLATIAHPKFILKQIQKIESLYQVKDTSSYSNLQRVARLSQTFELSDIVIPRSKAAVIRNSYKSNGIKSVKQLNSDSVVDTNIYKPIAQNNEIHKVTFLTAGIIELKKGVPLLLDAWNELKEELSTTAIEVELLVAGPVDKTNRLIIEKYFKNIPDVHFLGRTKKMHEVYQKADVFVAASICDLGPRTIMEAVASGLPVIASQNCGHTDLIDEEINGFTYEPFDTSTLKGLLLWFVQHPEKIIEMGEASRKRALQIEGNDFNQELYTICQEAIQIVA